MIEKLSAKALRKKQLKANNAESGKTHLEGVLNSRIMPVGTNRQKLANKRRNLEQKLSKVEDQLEAATT